MRNELNFVVSKVVYSFCGSGVMVETPEYLHSDLHSTYVDALRHVLRVLSWYLDDGVVVRRHWYKSFAVAHSVGRYLRVLVFDTKNEKVYVISVCGHMCE